MPVAVEPCPGCGVRLPPADGPTHRYIGASPACWAVYTALLNGGEGGASLGPAGALLVDAYAAQHPGVPSPQAIQSVAVHLLTLLGVLERGVTREHALWVRQRAVRERGVFRWLAPPAFDGALTVADVAAAEPGERGRVADAYVAAVWGAWAAAHRGTLVEWYERHVTRG